MSTILSILNDLESNPKRTEKERILFQNKNNELLKKVFRLAYDPSISYGIKGSSSNNNEIVSLEFALVSLIEKFATRMLTGNRARDSLQKLLDSLTADDAEVIVRILNHDLRCGVGSKTILKIWPGLYSPMEVMLAGTDCSYIDWKYAVIQTKIDGARAHFYWNGATQTGTFVSRNGKEIETHGTFDFAFKGVNQSFVLDGELLCNDAKTGEVLSRKQSNGIITKGIRGTISQEEAARLHFVTWDIVDPESVIPYWTRFDKLCLLFNEHRSGEGAFEKKFKIVDSRLIHSQQEADDYFQKMLLAGEEGAVVKNLNAVWEPKRSKNLCKMKAEKESELLCVAWEDGKGKFEGMMGNLLLESSDGGLKVSLGSGFTDKERTPEYVKENFLGKILTVRYNEPIQDKKTKVWSLFLPRFIEVRFDKDNANSTNEILEGLR